MESILGYGGPNGWTWLDDAARSFRSLFSATFRREAAGLTTDDLVLIEKARTLGVLLRYGLPTEDTSMLEEVLKGKCRHLPPRWTRLNRP